MESIFKMFKKKIYYTVLCNISYKAENEIF